MKFPFWGPAYFQGQGELLVFGEGTIFESKNMNWFHNLVPQPCNKTSPFQKVPQVRAWTNSSKGRWWFYSSIIHRIPCGLVAHSCKETHHHPWVPNGQCERIFQLCLMMLGSRWQELSTKTAFVCWWWLHLLWFFVWFGTVPPKKETRES